MAMKVEQITALRSIIVSTGQDTNTAKTTVAKFLAGFLRRAGVDAKHIMIDLSGNPSDGEDLRLTGMEEDFQTLIEEVMMMDDDQLAIIDLGGHAFVKYMQSAKIFGDRSHGDAGLFVIPLMPNVKEQVVLATVDQFISLGVDPSRIVLVFTRVEAEGKDRLMDRFAGLSAAAAKVGFRVCSIPVYFASIIQEVRGTPWDLYELASLDPHEMNRQYRNARKANDGSDRELASKMIFAGKAVYPAKNFGEVFTEILSLQ